MAVNPQSNLLSSPLLSLENTHAEAEAEADAVMGNCQAVDNATLVIQHPNGKADKLFFPVSAAEIIKSNPGHYVAQLLTTTLYSSTAAAASKAAPPTNSNTPLRVTRIKLLRPTDTLVLGHVYRLVTSEEVMKGLWAKKQAKLQQQKNGNMAEKHTSDFEAVAKKTDDTKKSSNNQERHRSRKNTQVNSGASKSRAWQPALKAISEATGS